MRLFIDKMANLLYDWGPYPFIDVYYLRRAAKVMFSSLLVFLSLSNIAGKGMNGFSWKFQDRSGMKAES